MDSTRSDHRSLFESEELYQQFRRILFVEKYIMLPIKTVIVLVALFFVRVLIDQEAFDEALFLKYQILLYILGNLTFIYSIIKIGQRKFRINVVQVSAFFLSIMDCLFLSVLVYLTEGVESPLYWAYMGLIMRNAVNFPKAQVQGVINVACCIFYIGAVILTEGPSDLLVREVFILRILALVLVSGCCWGIYSLVRQKTREGEEFEELKLRKDKMLGLSRMAGEIAHEIKNPLSIVNNAAYYILKHMDKGNEKIRQQVKTIQEEVLRADKILTNMLDFAKLSNLKISRINVQNVIDETLESMLAQYNSNKVKVIKEYEKVPPELLVDEGQLRQVIRNIVKNALAAMSDKKGVLLVRLEYIKSGSIKVLFSDTGGGFGDVPVEKLFSAFYTTKPDGTGLGLPVVRNIVESYNGTIEIENWKDLNDAGAVVTVVFPMRTARSNRTGE